MMHTKTLAIFALIITAACFPLFSISARLVNVGIPSLTQVAIRIGIGLLLTILIFQKILIGESLHEYLLEIGWHYCLWGL